MNKEIKLTTDKERRTIMDAFEKQSDSKRFRRERKSLWPMGRIYKHADINRYFLAYEEGYLYAIEWQGKQ